MQSGLHRERQHESLGLRRGNRSRLDRSIDAGDLRLDRLLLQLLPHGRHLRRDRCHDIDLGLAQPLQHLGSEPERGGVDDEQEQAQREHRHRQRQQRSAIVNDDCIRLDTTTFLGAGNSPRQ